MNFSHDDVASLPQSEGIQARICPQKEDLADSSDWPSFAQIMRRLHREGIYLHPEQLAEFLLAHGLPVDLCYVPAHLRAKAVFVNQNYQGDMACLKQDLDQYCVK